MGERVEGNLDLFPIHFTVTNKRNHEFLMSDRHFKPRGFTLREVSPLCVVEPLEDQEKQKEMWEIVNDVDGLGYDHVLSIDPGDLNGSACREASVYGCWPRNELTYQPGGC